MPTCSSCGGIFDDTFQYCPYCGRESPPHDPVMVNKITQKFQSPLQCPKCHRVDRVSKVSAIVQGETSRVNGQIPVGYSYRNSDGELRSGTSWENFSMTQMSDLAKLLLPPKRPKDYLSGCSYYWSYIMSSVMIGVGGLSAILSTVVIFRLLQGTLESGDSLMTCFATIAFLGSGIASALYTHRSHKKGKTVFEYEMPMWEMAMKRWDQLFYCERDGSIFIPGESSVPVSKLMEYINWNPVQPRTFLDKYLLWRWD